MKSLKLSFALLIAVLAVGVTVATKASNRIVTRCFINVTFTNGASDVAINQSTDCNNAITQIAARPFVKAAVVASSLASGSECPPSNVKYCCVNLTETDDETASLLDLGEGEKRYFVADPTLSSLGGDIFCKPQP